MAKCNLNKVAKQVLIEHFAKIVNGQKLLTNFLKSSILDV